MNLPSWLVSTIMHTLEVGVVALAVILLAYLANYLLNVDIGGDVQAILVALLSSLPKGARASNAVPVPDYVNNVE